MGSHLNKVLSTILLPLIVSVLPPATSSDDTCPYPCYPPPTDTGYPATPATLTPPSQTDSGSYSPPAYYSPPAAYYPYNPPPYDGDSFDGITPPPPDPILPYFPYYYKKPPHKPEDESGGTAVSEIGAFVFICVSVLLNLM
ncbi:hypothetical protein SDJN02_06591, partial [Cucurbita argyrosperma subsp. argyrosperma]